MRYCPAILATLLFTLFVSIPSASADWNSTISSANPLHWFAFEEAAGSTSVADDQGSANVDGMYVGGVTLGTPGLVGNAATFDGIDGHVLVGGPNLAGDWTVESILRGDTENGGPSQGFLGPDFTAADDRLGLKAEQWNETGQLGLTVFGVVDVTYADAGAATPTDLTHVAYVGSGAGVELFVNGVSKGVDPTVSALSRHVLGAGAVRADGSLVDPLTGAMDELVIYDRALSGAELLAHYEAIPEPSTAMLALLGWFGVFAIRRRRGV